MRGDDRQPRAMFSYVSAEERVPEDHPLRAIRSFVDEILREMTREVDALYSEHGRPSIPPEAPARAQLLAAVSTRSERAPADGASRLQHPVSLVRGAGDG